MKNVIVYAMIIVCVMLTSCSNDDNNTEVFSNFKYGRLEATINGEEHISGPLYPAPYDANNNSIVLYCYNGVVEIGITIRIPPELGSYDIGKDEASAVLTYGDPFDFFDQNDDGPTIDYFAVEGTVTVSEINETKVIGTFEFTAEDGTVLERQRSVKEGVFDIQRQ
ncbi:hypothetical protein SAMN05421824_1044 [Hyunsoonleella jejuensis]|uniref:Lipocalin-like domain-containing protein n=1 Tax=Hyunsoonleella jejuensis TaxID=419940 RepID=A0A1H9CYQ3_9FLAO|nr:DUF6252 family protein [Hyunsoonleella jejuensis]SEQ05658.1 hypothetical protein SAMN05421824_1044 [Hyunsoonleella jejuensis]